MRLGKHPRDRGITLVELMIVVAMASVLFTVMAKFLTKNITFFKRMSVRQTIMQDSRTTIDRIDQMMRLGKAKSLVISTPLGGTFVVPNSRADFDLIRTLANGTTAYSIYLSSRVVYAVENPESVTPRSHVLANNVTGLIFTGNAMDPAIVGVSLRIDAPWDATNDPNRVSTLILANHIIKLSETP